MDRYEVRRRILTGLRFTLIRLLLVLAWIFETGGRLMTALSVRLIRLRRRLPCQGWMP